MSRLYQEGAYGDDSVDYREQYPEESRYHRDPYPEHASYFPGRYVEPEHPSYNPRRALDRNDQFFRHDRERIPQSRRQHSEASPYASREQLPRDSYFRPDHPGFSSSARQEDNEPPPYPRQEYPETAVRPHPPSQGVRQQGRRGIPPAPSLPRPVPGARVTEGNRNNVCHTYNSKATEVLGWIHIVISLIIVTCNIIGLKCQTYRPRSDRNIFFFLGAGIWGSAFILVAGILGIFSSHKKTTKWIIAFMVFSILSCFFCFVIGISATAIIVVETARSPSERPRDEIYKYGVATGSIMMILAVIQFFVSIAASCYCCAAASCRKRPQRYRPAVTGDTPVMYTNWSGTNAPSAVVLRPTQPNYVYPTNRPGTGTRI